jgi:hypothetical protein
MQLGWYTGRMMISRDLQHIWVLECPASTLLSKMMRQPFTGLFANDLIWPASRENRADISTKIHIHTWTSAMTRHRTPAVAVRAFVSLIVLVTFRTLPFFASVRLCKSSWGADLFLGFFFLHPTGAGGVEGCFRAIDPWQRHHCDAHA